MKHESWYMIIIHIFSWHVQPVATFAPPSLRVILCRHRRPRWHRHVNRLARGAPATLGCAPRRRWSRSTQVPPCHAQRNVQPLLPHIDLPIHIIATLLPKFLYQIRINLPIISNYGTINTNPFAHTVFQLCALTAECGHNISHVIAASWMLACAWPQEQFVHGSQAIEHSLQVRRWAQQAQVTEMH